MPQRLFPPPRSPESHGVDFSDPYEAFKDEIAQTIMNALLQAVMEAKANELPPVEPMMMEDMPPLLRDLYFRARHLAFEAMATLDPACSPQCRLIHGSQWQDPPEVERTQWMRAQMKNLYG